MTGNSLPTPLNGKIGQDQDKTLTGADTLTTLAWVQVQVRVVEPSLDQVQVLAEESRRDQIPASGRDRAWGQAWGQVVDLEQAG
jgi:hypothetical protein